MSGKAIRNTPAPGFKGIHDQLRIAMRCDAETAISSIRRLRRHAEAGLANPELLHELAVEQYQLARFDLAVLMLEWAVELAPKAETWNDLGLVRLKQTRFEDAVLAFGNAVATDGAFALAWQNLATALMALQRPVEAEFAAATALRLDSGLVGAIKQMSQALLKQGKFKEASVYLGAAAEAEPDSPTAWLSLAETLLVLRNRAQAEHCLQRTLALDPGCTRARLLLAEILRVTARSDEADIQLRMMGQIDDDDLRRVRFILSAFVQSEEQILEERARLSAVIDRLMERSHAAVGDLRRLGPNFYLAYHGLDDRDLQERWVQVLATVFPHLCWRAPHTLRAPAQKDRIRVGIASSHLKEHVIARLTNGLARRLPRDRFEVVMIDLSATEDTDELLQVADKVLRAYGSGASSFREAIAAEALDVMFYPDIGMEPSSFHLGFSRLAHVQCTSWGHPVTTGLPAIDYFISSELIEPPNADAHYSERLVKLKGLPSFYTEPPQGTPGLMSEVLPPKSHIYFCPQTLFKFHPSFDQVITGILERDSRGQIVVVDMGGGYKHQLQERLERRKPGITSRILFANRMSQELMFSMMTCSHVMLDTFPFGGGNTSYEGLAQGTPIVTYPGEFMRGRVTLGCYRKIGFEECVASSVEDYIERALRLANEPDYRAWVSQEILARKSALFNDYSVVDEFAEFFETAVAKVRQN